MGRRFRVEFTGEQAELAQRTADACRAVWNTGLEQRREYRRRGAWINYTQQAHELAEAKKDHGWLTQAPSHCLQQTLRDLDQACRRHGTFRVRWRSAKRWRPSFRCPSGQEMTVEKLNRNIARVKLPKLGWVRFRASRSLDGEILRSATLTKDGPHWYVSLLVDDGRTTPATHAVPETAVGVDRGVVVAVATSAGDLLDQVFTTPAEKRRALRWQRTLARAGKRSANRTKIRQRYAKLRGKETRRRRDFCRKTARQLAEKNAVVVLENLSTRSMTRRAKKVADPAKPGCYVPNGARAKSGLNRAILAKGWGGFERALVSVSRYTGTEVRKVAAAYTSQRCSVCLQVDPKSRESQAVFRCTACKHCEHADVNAAKNILAAGRADRLNACGAEP